MKNYLIYNIKKIFLIKLFINIVVLVYFIIIDIKSNNNIPIIDINYLRIFISIFISLSLSFDYFIIKNYRKKYLSFIGLDSYVLLLLMIYFYMKNIISSLIFIIFFPLTVFGILKNLFIPKNMSLLHFYNLSIILLIMCIYTYVIIPICIRKFLKLYKNN